MDKQRKPEMPAGEPGHIADPGTAESHELMEGAFRALLDWDLRVSVKSSSGGKLYTVYALATEDEDGERDVLVVDAAARELVQWVTNRRTLESVIDPDVSKGFDVLAAALAMPGEIPLYTIIDENGRPVLEGATAEDLRRWTCPVPDASWSADQRLKAAMTRLAGLYLDLATLRRDLIGLAELAKFGQRSGDDKLS